MANTSNLGLAKLDGTEKLKTFPNTFNADMDTIDTVVGNDVGTSRTISQAITKTEQGIAIVANGNTHSAISSGQYVYVKNHGSLAEGLYTASSAISANATLSGSNLTAVSGGGLNALNGKIDNLIKEKRLSSGAMTIPAGTVGTRGYQTSVALSLPTGSTILGYYIYNISYSQDDICQIFIYGGSLYFNFYRCIGTQHTNSVDACVVYI